MRRPASKTRVILATVFLCALILLTICDNASAQARTTYDNLVSVYAGAFLPSGDYPASYDSMGESLGVSVIRIDEYAGFEFGFSAMHLGGDSSASAYGMELLVHFQKEERYIQPYIALGMGIYLADVSTSQGDVQDTGGGMILKTGIRYFVDDKRFFGLFIKHFSNEVNININTPDANFGGDCICFEMGFWTD